MIAVDKGYAHTGKGSPERQLWCAVLSQALADAHQGVPAVRKRSEFASRCDYLEHVRRWRNAIKETISTRHWLTRRLNPWRSTVCDFAGVNEECFVKAAKTRISTV